MAFKIVWSLQAGDDLQAIVLFIAQDNPTVAELFGYQQHIVGIVRVWHGARGKPEIPSNLPL